MSDPIDRQAAIDAIANMEAVGYSPYATIGRLDTLLVLNKLPSAEWQGKWIETLFGWRCSVCGEEQDYSAYFKHCPMCGARLEATK